MMSLVAPLAQIYALEYDGEGKPFSSRSWLVPLKELWLMPEIPGLIHSTRSHIS
jgi:hypothetical protein